jgi:TBC1 domain family protein 5
MHQLLSRDHLEHDAFSLFSLLMKPMKLWYDPNLSIPLGDLANSQTTPLTSVGFVPSQLATIHPAPNTCPDHALVHPIVEKCAFIFHVYLKHADPELWAHLDKLEIEPQLWGIRWLRLLFTREFTYHESLLLWDGILAQDGSSLRLADFVCIAMLLRIREGLLDSDYTGALQLILRFPRPADEDSRIAIVLYQAVLLYQFPTPDTVSLIIQQNLDLQLFSNPQSLSTTQEADSWFSKRRKPAVVSPTVPNPREPPPPPAPRKHQSTPLQQASNPFENSKANPFSSSQQSLTSPNKAQSLSKSRSFLGALVDFRKSYSHTTALDLVSEFPMATTSAQPHPTSSVMTPFSPLMSTQNPTQSSPSQDTHCVANREVGQALSLCVNALEQNLFKHPDSSIDSSMGLALGALKHIRDIMLSGFSSGFDSNVMSPLIEYQSATTTATTTTTTTSSTHPATSVEHAVLENSTSESLHTSFSPASRPYSCTSRSALADSPELSFNLSSSESSSDSVPLHHLRFVSKRLAVESSLTS